MIIYRSSIISSSIVISGGIIIIIIIIIFITAFQTKERYVTLIDISKPPVNDSILFKMLKLTQKISSGKRDCFKSKVNIITSWSRSYVRILRCCFWYVGTHPYSPILCKLHSLRSISCYYSNFCFWHIHLTFYEFILFLRSRISG